MTALHYQYAEAEMSYDYSKRFVLTGLAELTYEDFSSTTTFGNNTQESGRTDFVQKYSLGLRGYVYDPRLAVFSSHVAYRDTKSRAKGTTENETSSDMINYDLSATFLPFRPISLSVGINKTDSTVGSTFVPQFNASSLSYGGTLKIDSPRLPLMRLEYSYWEFSSELTEGVTKTNRYLLDVRGNIRPLSTKYLLSLELLDYASPSRSHISQQIRAYADSVIRKGTDLRTDFFYSDIETSKFLAFNLDLEINPFSRFSHDYAYSFNRSETDLTSADSHRLTGDWAYRFSDHLTGRAFIGAGLTKGENEENGEKSSSYSLGTGLTYQRPVVGLDTRTYYNFSHGERRTSGTELAFGTEGELPERLTFQNVGVSIATRKLSFGTVYTDYDFFTAMSEAGDLTAHTFRTGITGRGPGKAYWRVEGNYQDAKGESLLTESNTGNIPGTLQGSNYGVRGEIGYPLRTKGLAVFNSGYEVNDNEGTGRKNFYYEARMNYRILKDLSTLAWWRESLYQYAQGEMDGKARDITLDLYYRFKKLFFTAEIRLQKLEDSFGFTESRSMLFKFARPF